MSGSGWTHDGGGHPTSEGGGGGVRQRGWLLLAAGFNAGLLFSNLVDGDYIKALIDGVLVIITITLALVSQEAPHG